ncbi:hypothetical protein [Leptospira interrogans]|uniref:hypothetical protein n=1 Tax=Leptospira interrogans TaxID=173 RepID=UPI0002BA24CF|nr:hypothetical protein [Leptospira interrogans]EMN67285.1 hypothetical protein LEP1GSC098_0954 [Leptospira interrogans serovar Grippotyphosa str. UI 08434]
MPAITPDHTPINAESFQEVEIISNHYREIETKSLDHFKDEFRKNENSLDKVSTVALIAFLKKSGNVYQDWRILKKNLTDKYTELQSSRNSEYELIYRKLVTNDKIKPTALIGDIFQSVVEDVLNVLYIWTDSEKKEQSKLIESIRDQSSKDKDENLKKLYRDMIQKKLKERDRSFILFQDLLKESAFNWNQAYRKKFHQSLAATVKKLESSKASKAEILNNKKAAKKAILGFYEEDKIQKYSIFMVDYFLDRLLEKESIVENKILLPKEPEVVPSKEKENMDSIQKKSEIQTSLSRVVIEPELKNEKPNPTKKECPITDLPDHLIKECYSDYLIVDLSTKEKRLELHRIRLGKENQNTRAEAIEFFSHCANKDISAIMLAESALEKHNITQEEEEKLNEMIRKQNACK